MKYIASFLTVALIVGLGYFGIARYIQIANGQSNNLVVTDLQAGTDTSGGQVLLLLEKLKSIQLDEKIFSDQAFQSLEDFTIEINPQPVGRQNPFIPTSGTRTTATPTR